MSNIQVQLRRGTTSQHNSFAGAVGEVTVDTDLDTLRVHDGSTNGGVRLAKHSELAGAGGGGTVTSVDSGTGLTGGPITTSGTLSIASGGVGTTQLANDAVTSAKIAANAVGSSEIANNAVGSSEIADDAVTFAKMTNISTATVIGRTSASTGNPELVAIKDEDNMASNSATALATQQSIKAYVDSQVSAGAIIKAKTSFQGVTSVTRNSNAEFNISSVTRTGIGRYTVTLSTAISDPVVSMSVARLNGTFADRDQYLLKDSGGNTVYSGAVTSIEIITSDTSSLRDAELVQLLVF